MTHDGKSSVATWWADLGIILCVALVAGLFGMAWPGRAMAATIVVNSLEDTVVGGDGVCTLREAILNAEGDNRSGSTDCAAGSGADTITFSLSGTINLGSGLGISSAGGLTIDGGGRITISTQVDSHESVLSVGAPGVLTLKNLTFSGITNFPNTNVPVGGVISNAGTMTISHTTVRDNRGGGGGSDVLAFPEQRGGVGILNSGTMTISHSTVRDNLVWDHWRSDGGPYGSGIYNEGILTISTSTVSGNRFDLEHESKFGGAIFNSGTLTISTSTVSGNLGGGSISGIYNEGTLTMSTSTISDNSGPCGEFSPACGIINTGTVKMSTSLIADGCASPITSLGYNLDKTGTCGLTGPGDQSNIDPRLDPAGLKANGGPTKTVALCTGSGTPSGCTGKSPAIDAIPTANCTGAGGNPLGIDQRAFFRPADGDRNGTVLCDMGAFEATSSPLQTLNSLVTFTPLPATYQTSRDTTGCPAGSVGKFRFTADLTNKPGSPPVKHLVAEVATLTKGNMVLNADGGLGGDGATVTFGPNGQYTDGVLSAKDHVTLPFALCLKTFDRFTFFVDVLGTR